MAMDVEKCRKLVALDEDDPLSRFALGQALLQAGDDAVLAEAAEHLTFANKAAPGHLATYHLLGQVLIKLGRTDDARRALEDGCKCVQAVGEGMGRDLGPIMKEMLAGLPS